MGVLRASFEIAADGSVRRAERQTVPLEVATWAGEPGSSSLRDDCDYQSKQGTDVVVRGDALAPGGKPVRSLEVQLRLGVLNKTVLVHGPRSWVRGGDTPDVVPGPSESFERVALDYENAFGGYDARAPAGLPGVCAANPVGRGFSHEPSALLGAPAPQLESPGVSLVAGPHQGVPPGFAAIGPHWQPRLGMAGTYDAGWQENRAPLPPDDYQEGFRRCAPKDQQLPGYLRGGEVIEISNMTAEGKLRVQLPTLRVHMATLFSDGTEHGDAALHTVLVLPNERRLELTYLAETLCQGREHKLQRARITCPGEHTWR